MADSRERTAWNHTAMLLLVVANRTRGKGEKAYDLEDFHPFLRRKTMPWPAADACRLFRKAFPVKVYKAKSAKIGD